MRRVFRIAVAPLVIIGSFVGSTSTASAVTGNEGLLIAVNPVRIADSRPAPENVGIAPVHIGANAAIIVPVAGLGGLPAASSISAVVLNVTVANPEGSGYLTVYPSNALLPSSSNLNFIGGDLRSNQVTVPLGPDGAVRVFAGVSATDVIVDVNGYYASASGLSSGAYALSSNVTPHRILDTRPESLVGELGPFSGGAPHYLCLPDGSETAPVVGMNVTMVNPASDAYVTIHPTGTVQPLASSVNAKANTVVSNFVTMTAGTSRCFTIFSNTSTHLVVDIFGRWDTPVGTQGRYVPLASLTRFYDTRPDSGYTPTGLTSPGNAVDLQVAGLNGVPAGVRALLMNVTAVDELDRGFLTVYSAAVCPRPVVSNVNYVVERPIPNTVISGIGTSCEASPSKSNAVSVYHHSGGYFLLDVAGYFTAS